MKNLYCLIGVLLFVLTMGIVSFAAEPAAVLRAAGGSAGGAGFTVLTKMTKVVSDKYKKINTTVVPGSYLGNITRVNSGELDLAVTASSFAIAAENGVEPYKARQKNVNSLFNVQDPTNYFVIVRKDFPYATVKEFIDAKMPISLCTIPPGSQTEMLYKEAFAVMGASWDEIKKWGGNVNFVSWDDAVSLFKDGHADMILGVSMGKAGWIMELASARDLKFLRWDPEVLSKVHAKVGTYTNTMKAGMFTGIDYPIDCIADGQEVVINAGIPEDVVYAITKAIAEGEKEFRAMRADYDFTAAKMAQGLGMKIHPGALKYYKEAGFIK